jgi:hypothetical protein
MTFGNFLILMISFYFSCLLYNIRHPIEKNTSVFITLEQNNLYNAKHVCIFVSSVGGRRFNRIRGRTLVCDSTPFSNSTLVSCEIPNISEAIDRTRPTTEADDDDQNNNQTNNQYNNQHVNYTTSSGSNDGNGSSNGSVGKTAAAASFKAKESNESSSNKKMAKKRIATTPSTTTTHEIDETYFVDGALTIMVCTYDEDVECDYRLTVYSNYPLKCADTTNCGEGEFHICTSFFC